MSVDEFRGYFVSYDLIVGVVVGEAEALRLLESAADGATSLDAVPMHGLSLDSSATTKETLLAERDWVAAYGFSYYIKVSARKGKGAWCGPSGLRRRASANI